MDVAHPIRRSLRQLGYARVPLVAVVMVMAGSAGATLLVTRRVGEQRREAAPEMVRGPAMGSGASWFEGSYGEVAVTELTVDAPLTLTAVDRCDPTPRPWHLHAFDLSRAEQLLRYSSVEPALAAALLATTTCDATGCVLHPTADQVVALTPATRAVLYPVLAAFPDNAEQREPYRRPLVAPDWFRPSDLRAETIGWIDRLSYPHDGALELADTWVLCARVPEPTERERMVRFMLSTRAVLARLLVPRGADIEPLVRYWAEGDRADQVRPLLEALARVDEGNQINLAFLLPPFARDHLYRFPSAFDPAYDCHYSALNFFATRPDDRLLDPEAIKRAYREDYQEVPLAEARLGDILQFRDAGGTLIHAAVHIVGDVVFTKNGRTATQPWVLARRSDLLSLYDGHTIRALRRKPRLHDPMSGVIGLPSGDGG